MKQYKVYTCLWGSPPVKGGGYAVYEIPREGGYFTDPIKVFTSQKEADDFIRELQQVEEEV